MKVIINIVEGCKPKDKTKCPDMHYTAELVDQGYIEGEAQSPFACLYLGCLRMLPKDEEQLQAPQPWCPLQNGEDFFVDLSNASVDEVSLEAHANKVNLLLSALDHANKLVGVWMEKAKQATEQALKAETDLKAYSLDDEESRILRLILERSIEDEGNSPYGVHVVKQIMEKLWREK